MRWLFLLLLLINLGVFLWGYQREMNMAHSIPAPKPGVGNLRLWSEVKPGRVIAEAPKVVQEAPPEIEPEVEPAAATEVEPVAAAPEVVVSEPEPEPELEPVPAPEVTAEPKVTTACFSLTYLETQEAAEAVAKKLAAREVEAVIQDELVRVEAGYWVVIPTLPSDEEAKQKVRNLKAAGIRDVWRFTGGEKKNAISLGLFTNRVNAETVLKNAQAKGFSPKLEPRYRDDRRYWLEFSSAEKQSLLAELLRQLERDYPMLELVPRRCP